MSTKDKILAKSLVTYVVLIGVVVALLVVILRLSWHALQLPLEYGSDNLWSAATVKSIIDHGWYLHNGSLGAPGSLNLYDWFSVDNLHLVLIKFLAIFSHSWVLVMNLFFLLTFVLAAVSAFFVMRRLQLSTWMAGTMAILFAFLPYHFFRGEAHLFLSGYFIIPLLFLVTYWLARGELKFAKTMSKRLIACLIIVLLTSSAGIYYAFFSCLFLFAAGIIGWRRTKTLQPWLLAVGLIGLMAMAIIAQLLPNLLYTAQQEKNAAVSERYVSQTETLGLKIMQLVLPITNHRIPQLAAIKDHYNRTFPLITENDSASLGVVGSLGLLFLLLWLLFGRWRQRDDDFSGTLLQILSIFTLLAVLFATIGGLGTLLAMLIGPMIRAYNRLSVFIGFFALLGFGVIVDAVVQRLFRRRQAWVTLVVAVVVLAGGIFDQTYSYANVSAARLENPSINTAYANDAQFVRDIEAQVPAQSMIFELPYAVFPESPVLYQLQSYDLLRPYLHSRTLRWSAGAVTGRDADAWIAQVSALPAIDMIKALRDKGFAGIYLDRFGYADQGKELETTLTILLGSPPMASPDQREIFYRL